MNDNNRDLFSRQNASKDDLLSELDSLKVLLDEPPVTVAETGVTSSGSQASSHLPPSHITTVEEYFRWKAGQEAAVQEHLDISPAEEEVPTLAEVVEYDEAMYANKADAGAIPLLDEVVSRDAETPIDVPELLDVVTPDMNEESTPPSRQELLELVNLLVERRVNKLRETLTEEVMAELALLYPALQEH